jgi:hypothetical protein
MDFQSFFKKGIVRKDFKQYRFDAIDPKILHIKCVFFQFFNSPVALKNLKNFCPQEKVEMTPLFVA